MIIMLVCTHLVKNTYTTTTPVCSVHNDINIIYNNKIYNALEYYFPLSLKLLSENNNFNTDVLLS